MKRPSNGSTLKQVAYATRALSGNARSKKEAALLSGFSPSVAANAKSKIEKTEGYQNAVIVLAHKSNNLLLAAMAEFEARGLKKFSNADLTKALNAITGAWDRIERVRAPDRMKNPEVNPLRAVFTERVTRTATVELPRETAAAPTPTPTDVAFRPVPTSPPDLDLDF